MKVFSRYFVAAGIIMLLLPCRVSATEQTPEGAQEFLKMISDAGNVESELSEKNCVSTDARPYANVASAFKDACHTFAYYKTKISKAPDICKTVLNFESLGDYDWTDTYKQFKDVSIRAPFVPTFVLDWSRVAEVSRKGSTVTVGTGLKPLHFASESLAIRAAYAMDFLRQHCDVTNATGF
jgi:hypothetical protein